jgi:hypothetical protein
MTARTLAAGIEEMHLLWEAGFVTRTEFTTAFCE